MNSTPCSGSSPLTRGKLLCPAIPALFLGLIPAHAGKTGPFGLVWFVVPAHPRSRGENLASTPPCVCLCRLIPAHAGKTPRRQEGHLTRPAHPRSRGENAHPYRVGDQAQGSSPLTRGKPVLAAALAGCVGLIPAHAGKTTERMDRDRLASAHPRSRGENAYVTGADNLCSGSSPLTRGKPRPAPAHPVRFGLIPAHAGKTLGPSVVTAMIGAHPRSRGENRCGAGDCHAPNGSSPLTRGKLGFLGVPGPAWGLIPAHAGKTC